MAPKSIGYVTALNGEAQARGIDDANRSLAIDDPLHEGDILTTGEETEIQIEFDDSSRLQLGETTEVLLDESVFGGREPYPDARADQLAILQHLIVEGIDLVELAASAASVASASKALHQPSIFSEVGDEGTAESRVTHFNAGSPNPDNQSTLENDAAPNTGSTAVSDSGPDNPGPGITADAPDVNDKDPVSLLSGFDISDVDSGDSNLLITVTDLPSSIGVVTLADGTPLTIGQTLSLAELTTLEFDSGAVQGSDTFSYTLDDGRLVTTGNTTISVSATNTDFSTAFESELANDTGTGSTEATGDLFANDGNAGNSMTTSIIDDAPAAGDGLQSSHAFEVAAGNVLAAPGTDGDPRPGVNLSPFNTRGDVDKIVDNAVITEFTYKGSTISLDSFDFSLVPLAGPNGTSAPVEVDSLTDIVDYEPTPASGFTLDPASGSNGSNLSWTFDYEIDLDGNGIYQAKVIDSNDGSEFVMRSNGFYQFTPDETTAAAANQLDPVLIDYVLTDTVGHSDSARLALYTIDQTAAGSSGMDATADDSLNDAMIGDAGDDIPYANDSDDARSGGAGNESWHGASGEDYLAGGDGQESFEGSGHDTLGSDAGNDLVDNGSSDEAEDCVTDDSGGGIDIFAFETRDEGDIGTPAIDTIADFTPGIGGDVLDLSDMLRSEDLTSLDRLLNFNYDAVSGDTTISIVPGGSSGAFEASRQVVLTGVDLTANGRLSDRRILDNLLANGNLIVNR